MDWFYEAVFCIYYQFQPVLIDKICLIKSMWENLR